MYDQVRKRSNAFIRGLNLNGTLLAMLNECDLLTREDFSDINAHITGNNILAAGTHFINSVVMRWPYEVFEEKVHLLIGALQNHDDCGNESLAKMLCELNIPCAGDAAAN